MADGGIPVKMKPPAFHVPTAMAPCYSPSSFVTRYIMSENIPDPSVTERKSEAIVESKPDAEGAMPAVGPGRRSLAGFVGGLVGGAILMLIVAAGLAVAWPSFSPILRPKDAARDAALESLDRRVAALEAATSQSAKSAAAPSDLARLADLDRRLDMLEQQSHVPPAADARIAALAQKIDQISSDVTNMRNSQPDQGTLARLTERAEAAAQTAHDIAAQRQSAEALLLVVGQLRDAVERGDPYETELAAARQIAPVRATSALDSLSADATTGIARERNLIEAFPVLARNIVRATTQPQSDDFWQELRREASTLVSVRRIDGKGDSTAAIVARAEQAVKDGDLAGAVKELSALSGAPADAARDWIAAAKARLAAEQALSQVSAEAAAATAKQGG